jgi:hypothetical protein
MDRSLKKTIEQKYLWWAFFYFHLALYIGTNIMLILANLLTGPRELWFIIPLASWGVWIFGHFLVTFFLVSDSAKEWRESQIAKGIAEEKGETADEHELRQKASVKLFFWMLFYFHLAVFLGGNTIMITINLLVAPAYLWCIIPLIGWGLWLLFHYFMTFLCLGDQIKIWRENQLQRLLFKEFTSENSKEDRRAAFLRYFSWNLFYLHLGLYVLCNLMMFIINALTDRTNWWYFWPLAAWGIFLVAHFGFTYAVASEVMVKWREEQLKRLTR